jgi:hypothetical protein
MRAAPGSRNRLSSKLAHPYATAITSSDEPEIGLAVRIGRRERQVAGEPGIISDVIVVTTGVIVCHASVMRRLSSARLPGQVCRTVHVEQPVLRTGRGR